MNPIPFSCGTEHNQHSDLGTLEVRPIVPSEADFWDNQMDRHHYLGFRTLVGESLKYIALLHREPVALLGWSSAAFKVTERDRWIGWSEERKWRALRFVAANSRFLILPGIRIKHLASRVLALTTRRLSRDWQAVYGHPLLLAETFVDQARFRGTCYRAANWLPLGPTTGYGRNGKQWFQHHRPKTVFVYPLHRQARRLLCSPFWPGEGEKRGETIMSRLGEAAIDGPGGLLECLEAVPDPRLKRGVRHRFHTILAIAICAFLSNCHNYLSMGHWARELPSSLLKRFGCRFDGQRYVPPSESTLRRTLQAADTEQVDRVVGEWFFKQTTGRGIAVDGKTVRGSAQPDNRTLHLLSAFVHQEGMTVAQRAVDPATNEITQLAPLLAPLDLRGKVVTADAMHTQRETARYLVEEKDADYLLTVKDNQSTLLEDLQALEPGDFSPSPPGDQPGSRSGGTTHGPGEHHPQ